jgi:hypothetical protein
VEPSKADDLGRPIDHERGERDDRSHDQGLAARSQRATAHDLLRGRARELSHRRPGALQPGGRHRRAMGERGAGRRGAAVDRRSGGGDRRPHRGRAGARRAPSRARTAELGREEGRPGLHHAPPGSGLVPRRAGLRPARGDPDAWPKPAHPPRHRVPDRARRCRGGDRQRRRGREDRSDRGRAADLEAPHRVGSRRRCPGRVARPRRSLRGGGRWDAAGGSDGGRRPPRHLLHERHGQLSEDGAACPVLPARSHPHRPLLARPPGGRPALDGHGHGMGQGGVGRSVRAVVRARLQRTGEARQADRRRRAVDPRAPRDHLVLCAANRSIGRSF